MALYSDKFLDNLSENPLEAIIEICEQYIDVATHYGGRNIENDLRSSVVEFQALVLTFVDAFSEHLPPIAIHELGSDPKQNIHSMIQTAQQIIEDTRPLIDQNLLSQKKNEFAARFSKQFAYTFSEGDLKRIQELLNQLRQHISDYEDFEEQHRRRLLNRLEKLQSELHKKVSDLDHFWGLVGDAGVALGKFGNDAKPIVDRIKEITQIVWRTQSDAEGLPSSTRNPMIENDDSSDE